MFMHEKVLLHVLRVSHDMWHAKGAYAKHVPLTQVTSAHFVCMS